jgi:hypothetical protein
MQQHSDSDFYQPPSYEQSLLRRNGSGGQYHSETINDHQSLYGSGKLLAGELQLHTGGNRSMANPPPGLSANCRPSGGLNVNGLFSLKSADPLSITGLALTDSSTSDVGSIASLHHFRAHDELELLSEGSFHGMQQHHQHHQLHQQQIHHQPLSAFSEQPLSARLSNHGASSIASHGSNTSGSGMGAGMGAPSSASANASASSVNMNNNMSADKSQRLVADQVLLW